MVNKKELIKKMFPNLKAEMARQNISSLKISEYIGCTPKTFSSKLNGKTEFTRSEIFKIQKLFFPTYSVEYLFKEVEQHSA